MTDTSLMVSDCPHGELWYECSVCNMETARELEALAQQERSLSEKVLDAITSSDCYCDPGDATCGDWTDKNHRWSTIHVAVMRAIDEHMKPRQSNMVDKARCELEAIGEDADIITGYLNVVQAFADMGHSGGSAEIAIPVIHELLQQKPLSDLTNDPNEWNHVAEEQWGRLGGIWQSRRNHEAFSNDGGKTYYLLSEGGNDNNRQPLHTSITKG